MCVNKATLRWACVWPGMPGTTTQMGREEFAELVQSSIQDCQVGTLFTVPTVCSTCAI